MMETAILTKKQQKSSLSARRNKTKDTIRNVLATPYTKYWPLIAGEHFQLLKQIISKLLPIVVQEKVRIPWKQFKVIPKSERKLFKEQNQSTGPNENTVGEREGLIFGVNDVTKAIEKAAVKSILITDDVQPKLIVEHLIDQCVLLRIPVLVIPGLRSILHNVCRLSSITIAFTDDEKYKTIQETIESIYNNYPVPRSHVNFDRSLELMNSSVIVIEDSICEAPSCSVVKADLPTVYLYRQTKDKRIFIPEKSRKLKHNSEMEVDDPTCIIQPMEGDVYFPGDYSVPASKKNINVRKKYKSLNVKRVKGDINRNKRKIEEMKQKSQQKPSKNWKRRNQ